mgnify:CR=1 FL=1
MEKKGELKVMPRVVDEFGTVLKSYASLDDKYFFSQHLRAPRDCRVGNHRNSVIEIIPGNIHAISAIYEILDKPTG